MDFMKRIRRYIGLVSIFAQLVLVPDVRAEQVYFIESPFGSLAKTRQMLAAADVRVMLPLGYKQRGSEGVFDERAGVLENRTYRKGRFAIEIAIIKAGGGGYEFALTSSNAPDDLDEAHNAFKALARKSKSRKGGEPDLAYEMFRLGHIEADRALALLKALGYHTVEFEAKSNKNARYEQIFEVVQGKKPKLPWVVKVSNASKTSLLEADPVGKAKSTSSSKKGAGAPQLGGSHLHNATTGAPEERLLFVYDREDPEPLERLVNMLRTQIDLPAQQIVIEALVIEVNTSQLNDLGVEFSGQQENAQLSFQRTESGNSLTTFLFSRDGFADFIDFRGKLEALKETGDAEVLSSPSVLVLNDRQARIQVGRQIPVAKTTATTSSVSKGIEYFPVGIVLNLRPRINREGTEVTMQIETIISSISVESAARLEQGVSGIEFSPIIDNRLVETYVRVADGTPFIIGGLLSTEQQGSRTELPLLGGLPVLGRLFSRERLETEQREVIVVITPHIVPLEDNSFSYLIPKDSEIFDRFDTELFRNAYRVRDDDVWDLKFVQESPAFIDLQARVRQSAAEDVMLQRREPFHSLLQGSIPGEDVLVRRMLYEIVGGLGFADDVKLDQVFFFSPPHDETSVRRFSDDLTLIDLLPTALASPQSAVIMSFAAQPSSEPGHAFGLPIATVRDTALAVEAQDELLWTLNRYDDDAVPEQWSILLANEGDVERLRQALILKRVLKLNQNMAQTMQGFRPGVQILFPTREDMRNRWHAIDREVAQLFYESKFPYLVSEREFEATVRQVEQSLGGGR